MGRDLFERKRKKMERHFMCHDADDVCFDFFKNRGIGGDDCQYKCKDADKIF